MKRITCLLALGVLVLAPRASAQITITESDVRALIGTTETAVSYDAVSPSAAIQALAEKQGANQTWDFTGLTYEEGEVIAVSFFDQAPAGAPGGTEAPLNAANLVSVQDIGTDSTAYSFQDIRGDGIYFIGYSAAHGANQEARGMYDPAILSFPLPFTYDIDWTSDATLTSTFGSMVFNVQETRNNSVDGYGTLVTPFGSVPVLRMKQEITTFSSGFATSSTVYSFLSSEFSEVAGIAEVEVPFVGTVYSAFYLAPEGGGGGGGNPPAAAPTGLSPADGATDQSTDPTLSWAALADATSYDVQVATDAAFKASEGQVLIVDATGVTATSYAVSGLSGGTTYFWRIRGVNADGAGPWATAQTFSTATATAVEHSGALPAAFALHANYPNPFNPRTTLGFDLPDRADVSLIVVDLTGRVVAHLVEATLPPGTYQVPFEATNLPSGVYLYQLRTGARTHTRAMSVVK